MVVVVTCRKQFAAYSVHNDQGTVYHNVAASTTASKRTTAVAVNFNGSNDLEVHCFLQSNGNANEMEVPITKIFLRNSGRVSRENSRILYLRYEFVEGLPNTMLRNDSEQVISSTNNTGVT